MKMKILALSMLFTTFSSVAEVIGPIPMEVSGVMQCFPQFKYIPEANIYDLRGCTTAHDGVLPIKQFFEKFRSSETDAILDVRYEYHQNRFLIYYGTPWPK